MKKLVLTLCGMALAWSVMGQGAVVMNSTGTDAYLRFWMDGNPATNVTVGLYYNANNADPYASSWTMADGTANAYSGANTGNTGAVTTGSGGGNRVVGPAGTLAYFQLRAWTGSYANYGLAVASGSGQTFVSLIAATGAQGGANFAPVVSAIPASTSGSPPPTPTSILWAPGHSSGATALRVDLVPVPEPSTIALAGLGLLGLIFIRRRK